MSLSLLALCCAGAASKVGGRPALLSSAEVRTIAKDLGYDVRVSAFAAFVKVELLGPDERVIGESYAFAQPNGILHWDSIQTRRGSDYYARRAAAKRGAPLPAITEPVVPAGIFGPSVLLAAATLAWVREDALFPCHTAEMLAIRDDDRQHKVLLRFYKVAGLVPVREVGEGMGLQSVVDQLLYGGCGVLMQVPTVDLAQTCAKLLQVVEDV